MGTDHGDVPRLLARASRGEPGALDDVIPVVHAELRRLARRHLRNERGWHTLQPTALVNEAYLQLAGFKRMDWKSRAHFMAVSSRLMRQILVDHARKRAALRRGGAAPRAEFDEQMAVVADGPQSAELVDLDRALRRLEAISGVQGHIVEMQYFGGMTVEEIAEVLGISPRTVKRQWAAARAWLHGELTGRAASSTDPKSTAHDGGAQEPD